MKLVELSINNHIVDAIHKLHITQHVMEHSTSAPNERVSRTTQLTHHAACKVEFQPSIGRTHS